MFYDTYSSVTYKKDVYRANNDTRTFEYGIATGIILCSISNYETKK